MAINGAWAFALKPRLREALGGIDPLVTHNDDGIIMRLPPMELAIEPFARALLEQVRADTVEELLIGELADAPMLALRFREAAQRALLLPKAQPNHRTPLWLRRQRAADLLSIVRRKEGFPVLQEAVRECLHDTWDLNGLRAVLRGIESGEIATPFVANRGPSPFAGSLVWDFAQTFGEEGDAPRGECRAAYLALNRDLLRETLEAENLRQLLDPDVVAEVEHSLSPRQGEGARAVGASAQDIRQAIYDYMRERGPRTAAQIADALNLQNEAIQPQLNALVEASQLSCGEYLPGGTELEYCAPLILARLHRESLRRAREQVAPVEAGRFAAFLPAWQGLGQPNAGRRALMALLHLPLSREQWQAVLAARFGPDGAAAVDNLTSRGLLEWRTVPGGKLALAEPCHPERSEGPGPSASQPGSSSLLALTPNATRAVAGLLERSGALFTADIARRLARAEPPASLPEVEQALDELERSGAIANDLLSRTGRWSLATPAKLDAETYLAGLLKRYGLVCREMVAAEKMSGFRWAELERLLQLWEWRGRVHRGDFVRDLSGPQFALREAVDQLREASPIERPLLLAWEDPANPWGRILPLGVPRGKGRFIVLLGGQPLLTAGGFGRDLLPGPAWTDEHVAAAIEALKELALHAPSGMASLETWRGGSILVSPLAAPLKSAGFLRSGLRLVYRRPALARLDLAVYPRSRPAICAMRFRRAS
jgi:ATP-dependent Lhr-like helicase